MKIAVILPAAGAGRRFGGSGDAGGANKIEAQLAGRAVFLRAVELFVGRSQVGPVILAVNPDTIDDFKLRWGDKLGFHGVQLVPGGRQERWETVRNALSAVDGSCTHVAVHDAARPLTSAKLIDRLFDAAQKYPAVIPAVAVNATLKRVIEDDAGDGAQADPLDAILGDAGKNSLQASRVVETIDRCGLVEVQTPQVFEVALLRRAYAQITDGKLDGGGITDDAAVVESLGEPVHVVDGDALNIKITRPDDLKLAEAIYKMTHDEDAALLAKKRLFADDDDA
ncbi:MAG: 2-C-methyl-D-erythritol 4-phosphate cytidylyltransferase [Phycisphaeraceae bacterium]